MPLEESERRAAAGEPFAVRLKVPREGRSRFADAVYGEQERDYSEIEDLVLLRSGDLSPLYNLSVVVDDIEMGITHVVRGQDHLTNTHKQILIYEALGSDVPTFAHLPLILAPNKAEALEAQARRGRLADDLPRPRLSPRRVPQLPRAARLGAGRGEQGDCRSKR